MSFSLAAILFLPHKKTINPKWILSNGTLANRENRKGRESWIASNDRTERPERNGAYHSIFNPKYPVFR